MYTFFSFDSQSSLNRLASIEDNDFPANTHSAAAYALSSYHSGGTSTGHNGTQMVVSQGKHVKSTLHQLEVLQDELFQL